VCGSRGGRCFSQQLDSPPSGNRQEFSSKQTNKQFND
jgi:hypothetical protein